MRYDFLVAGAGFGGVRCRPALGVFGNASPHSREKGEHVAGNAFDEYVYTAFSHIATARASFIPTRGASSSTYPVSPKGDPMSIR